MSSLKESINLKNRSASGPKTLAPEQGADHTSPTSTGRGGIKSSISRKNAGIVKSPGVEKTNSAS